MKNVAFKILLILFSLLSSSFATARDSGDWAQDFKSENTERELNVPDRLLVSSKYSSPVISRSSTDEMILSYIDLNSGKFVDSELKSQIIAELKKQSFFDRTGRQLGKLLLHTTVHEKNELIFDSYDIDKLEELMSSLSISWGHLEGPSGEPVLCDILLGIANQYNSLALSNSKLDDSIDTFKLQTRFRKILDKLPNLAIDEHQKCSSSKILTFFATHLDSKNRIDRSALLEILSERIQQEKASLRESSQKSAGAWLKGSEGSIKIPGTDLYFNNELNEHCGKQEQLDKFSANIKKILSLSNSSANTKGPLDTYVINGAENCVYQSHFSGFVTDRTKKALINIYSDESQKMLEKQLEAN